MQRATPPGPGQHPPLLEGLSRSSRRAAGPAAGDHPRHHRLDQGRAQGRRAKPPRRAPRGGSTGVRGVPARAASTWSAASSSRRGCTSSRRAASRPIGRRPTSAWPTTTHRFRSSPTFRRRGAAQGPGGAGRRPSSSTRRWRKRTRPTPTSGPTTNGTGGPPSRSSGAPSSCGPTTPTRTSPTAAFSRHAAGSTRPSRSSGGPWSWTRSRVALQANRALLDYFAGRYDEADSRLREVLKSDSTDVLAKWGLALVAEQQGRPDEAIAILEPISGASNNRKSSLGHAYAVAGKIGQARSILAALRAAAATQLRAGVLVRAGARRPRRARRRRCAISSARTRSARRCWPIC